MKAYRHCFALVLEVHSTVEKFGDHSAEFIIKAIEDRLAKLKADPKNWEDHLEHHVTEDA